MQLIKDFRNLATVDTIQLCQVFNQAFSDYVVPLQLTVPLLEQKMQGENVQLSLSAGAFDKQQPVGFILHGRDDAAAQVLYNGGTGVIPAYRGQRLVQQLYGHFLPAYREQGIQQVLLEVISSNEPAIKAYINAGFSKSRLFHCYRGNVTVKQHSTEQVTIERNNHPDWPLLATFADQLPSWSNSIGSIQREGPFTGTWVARYKDEIVGFISVFLAGGRIRQIGVRRDMRRRGIGSALLQQVVQEQGNPLSIINIEDRNTALISFLSQAGMDRTLSQFEMSCEVK